jgi:hypothetical protein
MIFKFLAAAGASPHLSIAKGDSSLPYFRSTRQIFPLFFAPPHLEAFPGLGHGGLESKDTPRIWPVCKEGIYPRGGIWDPPAFGAPGGHWRPPQPHQQSQGDQ